MILVAGEALIDLVPRAEKDVRTAHPGGGPFNAARTIGRLGVAVAFLGGISDDVFGCRLRDDLAESGVDLDLVVATQLPTTLAVASLADDGSATYRFYLDGTAASIVSDADVPQPFPAAIDAVYIGTLSLILEPIGSTLTALAERQAGIIAVVLDPNIRPDATRDAAALRARVMRLVRAGAIVKASEDDLAWLFAGHEREDAMRQLLDYGAPLVVITSGACGAVALQRGGELVRVEAPSADVVDTIGAGDAFGGALTAWWHDHAQLRRAAGLELPSLTDDELAAALRFAADVASRTCARRGADPPRSVELS